MEKVKGFLIEWNVWRLAIVRLLLFTFVAGASAFQTAMAGVEWENLTITQKVLVGFGVGTVMANVIIAFLDKTIERIASGKPPVANGTEPPKP